MKTADSGIRVEMGKGYMSATLHIDPLASPDHSSLEKVIGSLREAGVQISDDINEQVAAYVNQWQASEQSRDIPLTLEGKAAVKGEDGRVQWEPDCDPGQLDHGDSSADGDVDFYSAQHYINLRPGQVVARIIAPTEGKPGLDLRGQSIPARPGKVATMHFDPHSFVVDGNGLCKALVAGVLNVNNRNVSINPVLQVPHNVDFSTGHIQFSGDVTIQGQVCDCFNVNADGNVDVCGTIEAATIQCAGDLIARSGIACRGHGQITVGRDLRAKYLNAVVAEVNRHVYAEREIMGCQLTVGGDLDVSRGSVIGGTTIVRGAAHLHTVGSAGELQTELILAHSPQFQKMIDIAAEHLRDIQARRAKAVKTAQEFQNLSSPTADQREQMTSLALAPHELAATARTLKERLDQLEQMYARTRTVHLTVEKIIFAGVSIVIDDKRLVFRDSIKGPCIIRWNERRQLVYAEPDSTIFSVFDIPGIELHEA